MMAFAKKIEGKGGKKWEVFAGDISNDKFDYIRFPSVENVQEAEFSSHFYGPFQGIANPGGRPFLKLYCIYAVFTAKQNLSLSPSRR